MLFPYTPHFSVSYKIRLPEYCIFLTGGDTIRRRKDLFLRNAMQIEDQMRIQPGDRDGSADGGRGHGRHAMAVARTSPGRFCVVLPARLQPRSRWGHASRRGG